MRSEGADRLGIARQLVVSLIVGSAITLVLAMLRAGDIVPDLTDMLLRPGPYLAEKLGLTGSGGILFSVLGDGVFYGAIAFFFLQLRSSRKRRQAAPPAHANRFQPLIDRRRAVRVSLKAAVFIYGWNSHGNGDGGEPFSENTETINVSALGGLIPVVAPVAVAQKLIVINPLSNAELPCRVARTVRTVGGETMIGVEFSQSAANFWQAPEPSMTAEVEGHAVHTAD